MQPAADSPPDTSVQRRRLAHPVSGSGETPSAWRIDRLTSEEFRDSPAVDPEANDSKQLHVAWNLVNERELMIARLNERLESMENLTIELTEALRVRESELSRLRERSASPDRGVTQDLPRSAAEPEEALTLQRVSLGGWSEAYRDLELEFGEDSQFFAGLELDAAHSGFFVATYRTLPVGTMVELTFTTASGERLSLSGVVAWLREAGSPFAERPGLGIAFLGLPSAARATLEAVWRARPPLYVEV